MIGNVTFTWFGCGTNACSPEFGRSGCMDWEKGGGEGGGEEEGGGHISVIPVS